MRLEEEDDDDEEEKVLGIRAGTAADILVNEADVPDVPVDTAGRAFAGCKLAFEGIMF
jgi:hypothetical protein